MGLFVTRPFFKNLNFEFALINLISVWQYFRVPETQFLGTRAERSISVVESGKNAIWGEVSHSLPAKQKYKSMFLFLALILNDATLHHKYVIVLFVPFSEHCIWYFDKVVPDGR